MAQEIDEAWIQEAITRHRRTEQLQADLDARVGRTEVTVRSPDRLVEVLVCGDGSIRRVSVIGRLEGRTNVELSRSIEAAVTAAADAAAWARRTLYTETFGPAGPSRVSGPVSGPVIRP